MARITVEDCLNQIPNRFKLTLAATYRARELAQAMPRAWTAKTSPRSLRCAKSRAASPAWKCSAKFRPDSLRGRHAWLFGLKYASSGLLAALRAGSRLGRRTGKRQDPPPPPSVAAQEAADATSPVASLAPLTEIIGSYLDKKDVERVREAYRFADQAHLGQFRASIAYISPPIAVTEICAGWKLDVNALSAALLHDVMEDQGVTKTELAEKFGPEVAELVDGLSKLDRLDFATKAEQQAESFRKMLLAMARDVRVILIKLADRLHNMRTLDAVNPEKRRRIARETLDIYAPIAHRLGLNLLFRELQDLCFAAMHPNRYQVLYKAVLAARGNRREVISKIADSVRAALPAAGIEAEVTGREKTLFGIYRKMVDQKNPSRTCWTSTVSESSSTPCPSAIWRWARCTSCIARCPASSGLHRLSQGERLPVAAHHAGRPLRHAGGIPVPHPRHAPCGRGRRGLALAVQGRRPDPQRPAEAHSPVAAIAAGHPKPDRRFRRVPGARQGRPVPRRCLCVHPARQDHLAAARRRWTSPTRFTPTSATRPWPPRSTASSCRCAPK